MINRTENAEKIQYEFSSNNYAFSQQKENISIFDNNIPMSEYTSCVDLYKEESSESILKMIGNCFSKIGNWFLKTFGEDTKNGRIDATQQKWSR